MVLSPRPPNSASSSSPLCSGSQDLDLIDMDIDVPIDVDLDSDVDEDRTDLLAVSPETPTSNGPVSFDALSAHAQLQAILKLLSLVEWPVLYDSLECDVLVRSVSDRLSESSYHARRTLADLSDLATLFALDREKVAVSTGAVVVGGISWPETTCTTDDVEFNIIEEWSYANIGPDPMHAKLITYPAVLQRAFVDEGKPDWCRFLNHVGTLVGFLEKLYAPKADKNTFEFLRYYMVLMHRHKLKALLLDTPLRATMHSELKHLVGAHMDLVDHRIDARKKDIFLHNVNYFSDVYPPSLELRFGLSATHQPWTVSLCSMLLDHLLESLHFCHSRLKRKTALVTDAELRVAEALVWFTVSLWQLAQDRDLLGNFWTLWQCQFDGVPYWTVAHLFRSTPSGSAARRGKRKSVSKTLATPRAPEQVLLWIQSLFLPLGPLQRLARAKNNSFLATTLRKRTALGGYVVPICLPHDPRPQSTFTFSCREALEAIAPQGPSGSFDPNLIAKILLRQRDEEWDEGMHSEGALDDLLTVEAVVHPEMYLATLTQSRPPPTPFPTLIGLSHKESCFCCATIHHLWVLRGLPRTVDVSLGQMTDFTPCHFPATLMEEDPQMFQFVLAHFKNALLEACCDLAPHGPASDSEHLSDGTVVTDDIPGFLSVESAPDVTFTPASPEIGNVESPILG